jgi:hypothetical protein
LQLPCITQAVPPGVSQLSCNTLVLHASYVLCPSIASRGAACTCSSKHTHCSSNTASVSQLSCKHTCAICGLCPVSQHSLKGYRMHLWQQAQTQQQQQHHQPFSRAHTEQQLTDEAEAACLLCAPFNNSLHTSRATHYPTLLTRQDPSTPLHTPAATAAAAAGDACKKYLAHA